MGQAIAIRPDRQIHLKHHKLAVAGAVVASGILYFYPFSEADKLAVSASAVVVIFLLALFLARRPELRSLRTPEEMVRMARAASRLKDSAAAERYYCSAVMRLFNAGRRQQALDLFEEYFQRYKKVFNARIQLEICRELCANARYLVAARALEKLIEDPGVRRGNRELLEKAYLQLARVYADKLRLPGLASERYFALLDKFPRSVFRDTAIYQLQLLEQKERARIRG